MVVREGANYRVILEDGLAVASVWKRPDLTATEGGESAKELVATLLSLAAEPKIRGAIFDFREAPPVAGPQTAGGLAAFLAAFEQAGKRVAMIHGVHPLQVMQVKRLLRENAPRHGAAFGDFSTAKGWLAG